MTNDELEKLARERLSMRSPDPPIGAFSPSPEDLIAKAAQWDVNEQTRTETQRLLDRLAEALRKERCDRATTADIIRQDNKDWAEINRKLGIARFRIQNLERESAGLGADNDALTNFRLYKTVRAIENGITQLARLMRR
jgi:hypothetical protein